MICSRMHEHEYDIDVDSVAAAVVANRSERSSRLLRRLSRRRKDVLMLNAAAVVRLRLRLRLREDDRVDRAESSPERKLRKLRLVAN